MTDTSNELTHELVAVNGSGGVKDLKIIELATKKEVLLRNDHGMDSAVLFEMALERIIGESGVQTLYRFGNRPKVTRANIERVFSAYYNSLEH